MDRKGSFGDIFIFIIFALIVLMISGIFIYIGVETDDLLHETFKDVNFHNPETNATRILDDTFSKLSNTYQLLSWLSALIIFGMILGIFVGSYIVTTKPVFFIPYIFVSIIAVVVSTGISNAYEDLIATPELATSFSTFIMGNYIMAYLPMWVIIIGIVGAIIMFSRMGSQENLIYGGYQ